MKNLSVVVTLYWCSWGSFVDRMGPVWSSGTSGACITVGELHDYHY